MALNPSSLMFTTSAENNPVAQFITIQNTAENTLAWTAGTPSAARLIVTLTIVSDTSKASSPATFNVDLTGLSQGTYAATVVIMSTPGEG
jgi:hypothetical protein